MRDFKLDSLLSLMLLSSPINHRDRFQEIAVKLATAQEIISVSQDLLLLDPTTLIAFKSLLIIISCFADP
jgi:hypothetical protein